MKRNKQRAIRNALFNTILALIFISTLVGNIINPAHHALAQGQYLSQQHFSYMSPTEYDTNALTEFKRLQAIGASRAVLGESISLSPSHLASAELVQSPAKNTELDTESLKQTDWFSEAMAYIESSEYHLSQQSEGHWVAPNRKHNLRVFFGLENGLRLSPRVTQGDGQVITKDWEWRMTLSGYGYDGQIQPIGKPIHTIAKENRFEYQYSSSITEWYVNEKTGLEQGFTLTTPPVSNSSSPLILELSFFGDLVPKLINSTLVEFSTEDETVVLNYSGLKVYDSHHQKLPAYLELKTPTFSHNTFNVLRIVIDDTKATYPLTVDPTFTWPWATDPTDQNGAHLGISVDTAGDVNNDGFDDIVIGASGFDNGYADEGRAYLYHGSADGPISALNQEDDWQADGISGSWFGASVANAGDVNGDGYDDVLIGAPYFDNGTAITGRGFIFYGAATGISDLPSWEADGPAAGGTEFGISVSGVGDVNNDGYADVAVGAPSFSNENNGEGGVFLYYGAALGPNLNPDWSVDPVNQNDANFGQVVAGVGDVNNDGISDMLISAPNYGSTYLGEGAAYLFLGSPIGPNTTPDWNADPTDQAGAGFGIALAAAGDVNSDNISDVIIGASGYDDENTDEGRAYVYQGSATTGLNASPDWYADPVDQDGAEFGSSVSAIDPQGSRGVIVGAPKYDNGIYIDEGRVFVFPTASGFTENNYCTNSTLDTSGAQYGQLVSPAGDTDGDEVGEVLVGGYRSEVSGYGAQEGYLDQYTITSYGSSPFCELTGGEGLHPTDQADSGFGLSAASGNFNGDSYTDVVAGAYSFDIAPGGNEGRAYAYYGSPHGLIPPDGETWYVDPTDQANAYFGASVSAAGDVNADGYADIIVGAYGYDTLEVDNGLAFVYLGSNTGMTYQAIQLIPSIEQAGAQFGFSVSTAGDVNGDGLSDVIIGAVGYDGEQSDEGRAYVFYGSFTGVSDLPDWVLDPTDENSAQFGFSVSTAGDMNNDGFSEIIVGAPYKNMGGKTSQGAAYLYRGSGAGLETSQWWVGYPTMQDQAHFGYSVSNAGDVNNDGYADIIVGAPYYDAYYTDRGRAYVYHGGTNAPGNPNWAVSTGSQHDAHFGISVAGAGDLDGDDYDEVIVGADTIVEYADESGEIAEGRAYVFKGTTGGLYTTHIWNADPTNQDGAKFGTAVASAGDVNGDGYADVIIGAPYYDRYPNPYSDEGRVYLYYGSGNGLTTEASFDWLTDPSNGNYSGNGYVVGTAGDVNGDGFADVMISSWNASHATCGVGVYVYHGSTNGFTAGMLPNWHGTSPHSNDCFGSAASTAGDVNGDGYDDLVVGAYNHDDNGDTINGDGAIYVYFGSASGLSATADWTKTDPAGPGAMSQFGYSVSAAGDVDNDGYGDIVVGSPHYSGQAQEEGRVYVYYGNASGFEVQASFDDPLNEAYAYYGKAVGAAGDVNGDGYDDVIAGTPNYQGSHSGTPGIAIVYQGSINGINYTPLWGGEPGASRSWPQFGHAVGTAGDVNGDGYADIIVSAPQAALGTTSVYREGAVFVFHGSASGPSTVANVDWWDSPTDQSEAYFGWSVSTAGDVNGDGYADIIIGAPWYSAQNTAEGRAYIYHGSNSGLSANPDWLADPTEEDATHFGMSVGFAGDVNGDGFSDVIVGAPEYDIFTDEGRAYLFHGAPNGLSATPETLSNPDAQNNAYFGFSVASAGDVNGDGYSDVIVGAYNYDPGTETEGRAYVFLGTAMGLDAENYWNNQPINNDGANLGWSVGTAGDVNGDGYSDVIIGAPGYGDSSNQKGRVYVYHGSSSGLGTNPDWILDPTSSGQTHPQWGWSVGTAGDVNSDGYSDIIIGAPYCDFVDLSLADTGSVVIYYGHSSGLTPQASGADWVGFYLEAGANYGYSVGTAGDVNGDGNSDIIIGIPNADNTSPVAVDAGGVVVHHGSPSGLTNYLSPNWSSFAAQNNNHAGWSVGTAGDVNGDGYSDVIIGSPDYDTDFGSDEGRAYVYHGSASGLSVSADWYTSTTNQGNTKFGHSVGTAGDVNGDGYSDVIIGARLYNTQDFTDTGRAYVFHGSAAGVSDTGAEPERVMPDWQASDAQETNAQYGYSVATAGDVNGDGYSDILVGAPIYDDEGTDKGQLYVYYGNNGGQLDAKPRQSRYDGSAPIGPLGLTATPVGAFRINLLARSPFGRGSVKLQWEVKPIGQPFDGTNLDVSSWEDTTLSGAEIFGQPTGLDLGESYHWRVRLVGRTPIPWTGPWFTPPHNGRNESDLRVVASAQQAISSTGWTSLAETMNKVNVGTQGSLSEITLTGHPNTAHSNANLSMLGRYYELSAVGTGWSLDELCLHYDQDEVGSLNESDIRLCRWTGTDWTCPNRSASSSIEDNLACAANVTQFSDWTMGEVGPTAVSIRNFVVRSAAGVENAALMGGLLALALVGLVTLHRKKHS